MKTKNIGLEFLDFLESPFNYVNEGIKDGVIYDSVSHRWVEAYADLIGTECFIGMWLLEQRYKWEGTDIWNEGTNINNGVEQEFRELITTFSDLDNKLKNEIHFRDYPDDVLIAGILGRFCWYFYFDSSGKGSIGRFLVGPFTNSDILSMFENHIKEDFRCNYRKLSIPRGSFRHL